MEDAKKSGTIYKSNVQNLATETFEILGRGSVPIKWDFFKRKSI